jgi:hypothetical protein
VVAIGTALASVPYAVLFRLVARRLWRFDITFGRSYLAVLGGALLGEALPFIVSSYTDDGPRPMKFTVVLLIIAMIIPPFVWAESQDRLGNRFGMWRSLLMLLLTLTLLASIGLAVGYAWQVLRS